MGSWAESRSITKQCFGVVKEDPYMLLFPVVGGIVAIIAVLVVGGTGCSAAASVLGGFGVRGFVGSWPRVFVGSWVRVFVHPNISTKSVVIPAVFRR